MGQQTFTPMASRSRGAAPLPITAAELGTRRVRHDDLQAMSHGSERVQARAFALDEIADRPIILRVYADVEAPLELVFGDNCPRVTGEIAFGGVFELDPTEAAYFVQIGAYLAGQSLYIGELEPETLAAFEQAIVARKLLFQPFSPACGPRPSPWRGIALSSVYLTVLVALRPLLFTVGGARVHAAAYLHWHRAQRIFMKTLRARGMWPLLEEHAKEISVFLGMVDSAGNFPVEEPVSHIDALRHYSSEWALWRAVLGDARAGKRLAFPCLLCGALDRCAPGCSADEALNTGLKRAAAAAAAAAEPPHEGESRPLISRKPVVVDIVVTPLGASREELRLQTKSSKPVTAPPPPHTHTHTTH
jgi:hypothetical protein